MKRQKKQYSKPRRPFDKNRIEREKKVLTDYGLRRKKELWRAEAILRDFRRRARKLAAQKDPIEEKRLITRVNRLGLISSSSNLDSILSLKTENLLDRRLQTMIFRKGFANTPKQARQFIIHNHITIDGKGARWPSLLVDIDAEKNIEFHSKSLKLKDWIIEQKKQGMEQKAKKGQKPKFERPVNVQKKDG